MKKIQTLLNKKIIVLDGATGTEFQRRGMPQGVCPENWCVQNPKITQAVHEDYVAAGADIIYTCTFGGTRPKLEQHGITSVRKINKQLAVLARRAAGDKVLVAGDIGSTGRFVEPFGPLKFNEAVEIFKEQVKGLLAGGVDIFVIETMMDIQEARAALIAVKELTDAFTIVSMTYEKDGRTLNGTDPITALITLQSLGADAVGCNCSTGPQQMLAFIKAMKPYAIVPLVAKPNAGMPKLCKAKTIFEMSAREFGCFGKKFAIAGINMIGGCCGTTPEHIRLLKENITGVLPRKPKRISISALSSARKHIILEKRKTVAYVGERINPTGKKDLQAELREGKFSIVRKFAREQQAQGAHLLDVNAGAPGVDERKTLKDIIGLLAVNTELPLVIDSSKIEAVEKALRLYPGRTLINSISGEKTKYEKLLALAAKYGAMFVLLPLTEKEVPQTFEKRKKIIEFILRKAKSYGFSKDDIVIDGLVMSISSQPKAALETIKTVKWSSRSLKLNTVVGLSNVSFGLPGRGLINSTYLSILRRNGLSMVIINPCVERLAYNKKAEDVLLDKDKDAKKYIAYYQRFCGNKTLISKKKALVSSPEEKVLQSVMDGNRQEMKNHVKDALAKGVKADYLINKVMIPAINKVGDLFDKKEYFLPQLIASAEAVKIAFDYLEPKLKKSQANIAKKTIIILATVAGDIHDIGKNIVALMLKNHGFNVVDLGKDVSTQKIIREIKKYKFPIVGLSALMTTTMVNMKEVVETAKAEGLKCRFLVGGAVVTKSYAKSIGAEYAADSVEAVRTAKRLKR
ncbi:MAG: dihydropteroate synthase [PVC group bacterium]|nr:dihydropteroate synthase [PVC group bacterium]